MIADEAIEKWLRNLFGRSQPGDEIHNLLVATAAAADLNALGLPPRDKLHVTFYAIAPVATDGDQYVAQAIRDVIAEAKHKAVLPYFAGLAMEVHSVEDDGDEVTQNLARRLGADRRLPEHPRVVEVTWLYAACRDGRRWTGVHILTGRHAGKIVGPRLRTGPIVAAQESSVHQRLVREAVGLA